LIDYVICAVLAYVIGSIPSGYWIGKFAYGVNLRTLGSGNIGATNAYRNLGAKAGLIVFLCDFFKGFIAAALGSYFGHGEPVAVLLSAVFAVAGNDFSLFLKFHGGKGISCGVGAFTFISAPAALAAFIVWLIVFKWKHIVSLASIIAAPVVPIVIYIMDGSIEYTIFAAAVAAIIIVMHHSNISRLIHGEEKPITRGGRKS
jgi:glycerol-3-phosphate acyltransferase PlsY